MSIANLLKQNEYKIYANEIQGKLTTSTGNQSSSTHTGDLIVAGGAGIGKNLFVGHDIHCVGGTIYGVQSSSSTHITGTTDSTDTQTGALIVDGGVGIVKNLNVGGSITVSGSINNTHLLTSSYYTQTGLIWGGGFSFDTNTTFNILAGAGYFVDYWTDPTEVTRTYLEWSTITGIPVTHIASYAGSWISLSNNAGTPQINQYPEKISSIQHRTEIQIGKIDHFGNTIITGFYKMPVYSRETNFDVDILCGLEGIYVDGLFFTPNGANLMLNMSSGNILRQGANSDVSLLASNCVSLASQTVVSFYRTYISASGDLMPNAATSLFPSLYNSAPGVLTTIPTLNYSIQTVDIFALGGTNHVFFVWYDQRYYTSMSKAIDGLAYYELDRPIGGRGGVERLKIIIREDVTDLVSGMTNGYVLFVHQK